MSVPAHDYLFVEICYIYSTQWEFPWEKIVSIEKKATAVDHAFASNDSRFPTNVENVFSAVVLNGTEATFERARAEFIAGLRRLPEGDFFFVDLWRKGRLVFFLAPFDDVFMSLRRTKESELINSCG